MYMYYHTLGTTALLEIYFSQASKLKLTVQVTGSGKVTCVCKAGIATQLADCKGLVKYTTIAFETGFLLSNACFAIGQSTTHETISVTIFMSMGVHCCPKELSHCESVMTAADNHCVMSVN